MRRGIEIAAAFVMPLVVGALVLRRAVNVPFLDEWSWAPLAVALHRGTLAWPAIVAQHNEHRNVVANLIFLGIDRTLGWNVPAEQLVSFALLCVAQAAAWMLVWATVAPARRWTLFAVLSLLVWSLAQWENVALGYNVGWNVCTAALFVLLALFATPFGLARVAGAGVAAVLATFASAQGAALFAIGLALIAVNARRRGPASIAWAALALATLAAFLRGYVAAPSPGMPAPGTFAVYLLTVLGTPVGAWWGIPACAAVGALGLAAFLALLVRALRAGEERLIVAVWACAAFYAVANAGVVAASRFALGLDSALSSHYAAIALFLYVAVAGLAAAEWDAVARAPCWALAAWGLVIAYGLLDADLHGNRAWQMYAAARRAEVCALGRHDDAALATLADADVAGVERAASALAAVHDVPYRNALGACAAATPQR
jgi:hypothetical protein